MKRMTNIEIEERVAEKVLKKQMMLCEKCKEERFVRNICNCPACKKERPQMFVHINQKNPATVDWNDFDQETQTYATEVSDQWLLCANCSRKYQVYATWD